MRLNQKGLFISQSGKLTTNTYMGTDNCKAIIQEERTDPYEREPSKQPVRNGDHKRLVLASSSPRRHKLIKALDEPIRIQIPISAETPRFHREAPEQYTLRLALSKAKEVATQYSETITLAADTVVVLDNEILGKPVDNTEAIRMLARLRGMEHKVITSTVAVDSDSGDWTGTTKSTKVTLRNYSNIEVTNYIKYGNPLDKAGSYAIQDRMFHPAGVVVGCYLNVIGLPLCEVSVLLARVGKSIIFKYDWSPPKDCRDCELRTDQGPSLA